MNTSAFLTALRLNAPLPLVFRTGSDLVSPGYHLTEVKRVAYETMDCGAMAHEWSETQFEVWAPASASVHLAADREHMAAGKFLHIIERVEAGLPLKADARARVHTSFDGLPAALYDIDAINARDGKLWIDLTPDRTRCKAAERRLASATGGGCGIGSAAPEPHVAATACCGSAREESTATVCCA